MRDDIFKRVRALLEQAASWHDLRRKLDDADLSGHLGVAAMDALLLEWHQREAAAMTDAQLTEELAFWSDGGTYNSHLKGFSATPPAMLVEQARHRGWFVKPLDSGGAVVNPPGGRPLVVRGVVS